MRAAIWNKNGSLDVEPRDLPEPSPGWVRLKVAACGICGSDLHSYGVCPNAMAGVQPGHELVGWIDALGDGVSLESGSLVAVEPVVACGQCPSCLSGHYNRCTTKKLFGFELPGGLADYVVAPSIRIHALPSDLDLGVAALAEPLAVCVRGVRMG